MDIEKEIARLADDRRHGMSRLDFFDAEAWLGKPVGFPLAQEMSRQEVASAMAMFGIRGCCHSHWSGHTVSAQEGNRALLAEALDAGPGFRAIWTGLPLFPVEDGPLPGHTAPPPSVCGVRLFPKTHNYPLSDWVVGGLCEWLIRHRLPLLVWHEETGWDSLRALAVVFPGLVIVVETQVRKVFYHLRPLFALMRDCPNVMLETSNLTGIDSIEYAVRAFGAERLLFGSFLPANDPLAAMGMIADADLPEEGKRLVAGGNLRRLIEGIERRAP
jgi:hypothetical protein